METIYTYEQLKEMSLEELKQVDTRDLTLSDRRTISDLKKVKTATQRESEITEGILKALKESDKLMEVVDCYESGNSYINIINNNAKVISSYKNFTIRVRALTGEYGGYTGDYKVSIDSYTREQSKHFYERKTSVLDRVDQIVEYVEQWFPSFIDSVKYADQLKKEEEYANDFVKELTDDDYGRGYVGDVSVEARYSNCVSMKASVEVTDENRDELKALIQEFSERVANLKKK